MQISLQSVSKDYKIRNRDTNRSKVVDFFRPRYDQKRAVDDITFSIEPGEMVGYIGPNGAGKSTTIKMLTGILTPTSGEVRVFGNDPCKNRKKNALKMGVVFGQRSQLLWDLPVRDTFDLFRIMYKLEYAEYVKQRDRLIGMLQMEDFLSQAVRQLSLGQRMRANLALCFLHKPQVVYLDEPTIGLDVVVKDRIRMFLQEINHEQKTTILLTTHDTKDIEEVAKRLMLIDKGKLLFDGGQSDFRDTYRDTEFTLEVTYDKVTPQIDNAVFGLVKIDGLSHSYKIKYDDMNAGAAISYVATSHQGQVADIRVRESELEDILKKMYND